jgi:hypothetical protein
MVRRLNRHRPAEQNHMFQLRKEQLLRIVDLSMHASKVRLLVVAFGSVD